MNDTTLPVVVSLRRPYLKALALRARELRMGDAEAAAHLLSIELEPYLEDHSVGQARAEREILRVAEELARAEAARPEWDEHLTLAVFRRIETDHLPLYQQASAGDQQRPLNRRIGRRIKEAVGAVVKTTDGVRPAVVHAPRSSQNLIRRYTLLQRS